MCGRTRCNLPTLRDDTRWRTRRGHGQNHPAVWIWTCWADTRWAREKPVESLGGRAHSSGWFRLGFDEILPGQMQ